DCKRKVYPNGSISDYCEY
nr:Chain A, Defensin-like protein [Pentadiplandra brazzeana]